MVESTVRDDRTAKRGTQELRFPGRQRLEQPMGGLLLFPLTLLPHQLVQFRAVDLRGIPFVAGERRFVGGDFEQVILPDPVAFFRMVDGNQYGHRQHAEDPCGQDHAGQGGAQ